MADGYSIQVVDCDGDIMYVRNGMTPGEGRVVRFSTRGEAVDYVAFMKMGMEQGEDYESIAIIPWREDFPEFDEEGNGR